MLTIQLSDTVKFNVDESKLSPENIQKMLTVYTKLYLAKDLFKVKTAAEKLTEGQKMLVDFNAYISKKGMKGTGITRTTDPVEVELKKSVMARYNKNLAKLKEKFKFEKLADWLKTDTGKAHFATNMKKPELLKEAEEIVAKRNAGKAEIEI